MKVSMLTTVDNPFDPFTQYDAWLAEDERLSRLKGVQTCNQYLARLSNASQELSYEEQLIENENVIDRIIKQNVLGVYRKVTKEL